MHYFKISVNDLYSAAIDYFHLDQHILQEQREKLDKISSKYLFKGIRGLPVGEHLRGHEPREQEVQERSYFSKCLSKATVKHHLKGI